MSQENRSDRGGLANRQLAMGINGNNDRVTALASKMQALGIQSNLTARAAGFESEEEQALADRYAAGEADINAAEGEILRAQAGQAICAACGLTGGEEVSRVALFTPEVDSGLDGLGKRIVERATGVRIP